MKLIRHIVLFSGIFFSGINLFAQDQYVWSEKATIPAVGRHRACGCAVNNRGYFGLGHVNNAQGEIIYNDWFEYDPGTDTWMQKANFTPGPRYHAIAFGIGNYAYVGTGSGNFGDNDDLWRYNPATNSWQLMTTVPGGVRSGAVAFVINGKGYIALGDFQGDCEEYDPATNTFLTRATSPVTGYGSVAGVVNNKAYVGVGFGNQWAEYNPANNTWTMKQVYPGVTRFGCGCFSYNGFVYLISGSDFSNEFSDSYAYNPATNQWTQISDFPGQSRHYMVCMNIAGRIYGGSGTSGTNYSDWWRYGDLPTEAAEIHAENSVSVFPNPVEEEANFSFSNETENNCEFSLYNTSGQLVRKEKTGSVLQWKFERNDLASGLYVYVFQSGTNEITHGNLLLK